MNIAKIDSDRLKEAEREKQERKKNKRREERKKGMRRMDRAAGERRPLIMMDRISKSIIININQFLPNEQY